jgi:hypothetical protein
MKTPTDHLVAAIVWELELHKSLGKTLTDTQALAAALASDLRQPAGPYCEGADTDKAVKMARDEFERTSTWTPLR